MSTFEFNGKVYRIVPDNVGELVAGCKKCAFYGDDHLCANVDIVDSSNHASCVKADHHYEEVTDAV